MEGGVDWISRTLLVMYPGCFRTMGEILTLLNKVLQAKRKAMKWNKSIINWVGKGPLFSSLADVATLGVQILCSSSFKCLPWLPILLKPFCVYFGLKYCSIYYWVSRKWGNPSREEGIRFSPRKAAFPDPRNLHRLHLWLSFYRWGWVQRLFLPPYNNFGEYAFSL